MRSFTRLALLALAGALASSCGDTVTGTTAPPVDARIAIGAQFTPAANLTFNGLAAFGMKVTTVRVKLIAADSSTRDTLLAFPSGLEAMQLDLCVPYRTVGQAFRAELELYDANGYVLFSGTQRVTARDPATPAGTPAMINVSYTGPGASAKSVAITPTDSIITGTGSLPLTAAGRDAQGSPISVLVRWTSSDASLAAVASSGNAAATVTSTGKRGVVTITAITPLGITGTTRVSLLPAASRMVVVSGGGQSAAAGAALPQPIVVEVQASDNLPVAGATVAFRAVTPGASVATASAVTDATGRASTLVTLGSAAGAYVVEASSGSLTPVTASVTATVAPPSMISVAGGNFQAGPVGGALAQPLVAKVTDRFGTPVSGVAVQWARSSATGGATTATTSTTGPDGLASMRYTLGTTVQTEQVRAWLAGVPGPTGEVFYSVGAVSTGPDALIGEGGGQHADAGSQLAQPLAVTVIDIYGNPVLGAIVTWSASSATGATVSFAPGSSTTGADGRASTVVTLGPIAGVVTVTASAGNATAKFNVTADAVIGPLAPGTLSGMVYNGVTGAPMAGVTVEISSAGLAASRTPASMRALRSVLTTPTVTSLALYTLMTGVDGRYTSPTLQGGCYDITVSYANFILTVIHNTCVNGNTVAEAVPLIPFNASPGTISGNVLNATTNSVVLGSVLVELRAGVSNTTGAVLQSTTAVGGQYQFPNVMPGTYTVTASASGFTTGSKTGISVGATVTSNQNVFLSPLGAAGSIRIVLTWRATPRDLDSHLTGPTSSGSRFHVWYGGQGSCTSAPYACLDVDVTSGYGPETVTIPQTLNGMYRYSVQNYTAAGNGSNPTDLTLSNSGGRVDVYINNVLAQSFSVPAGAGSLWTVFELNGTTITPINAISAGPVLFSSRIPATGAAQVQTRATDATLIWDAVRTHPKAGRPLR